MRRDDMHTLEPGDRILITERRVTKGLIIIFGEDGNQDRYAMDFATAERLYGELGRAIAEYGPKLTLTGRPVDPDTATKVLELFREAPRTEGTIR